MHKGVFVLSDKCIFIEISEPFRRLLSFRQRVPTFFAFQIAKLTQLPNRVLLSFVLPGSNF